MNQNNGKHPGTTTIIRRVQTDGSEESWEQFVHRYELVIVQYALSAGLRRDHAEDLRQTVLLELVALLPTLSIDPERGSFRSILRTIVRRRCFDLMRRHYREAEFKEKLQSNPTESQDEHWDRAWHEGLMKQALSEAAESVNPDSFQAFELTSHSSVPAKEVAKILGMSIDNVYQSKSRIRSIVEKNYSRLRSEAENPDTNNGPKGSTSDQSS